MTVVQVIGVVFKRLGNIVEKGDKAGNPAFSPFSKMFSKSVFDLGALY